MITLDAIRKTYRSGATTHTAIGNVSLTIEDGEFVSIVGPSGCGKSTLLNLIAGFIAPSAGDIRVKGQLVEPGRIPARVSACALLTCRRRKFAKRSRVCSDWQICKAMRTTFPTSCLGACGSGPHFS
jgi:ABC-type Fe3+/spermidine/putrescine transport system ATPase subunit